MLVAPEDAHLHHSAALAVRHPQGSVFHLARLLAKDRAQQLLFRGQLGLALGRDLADQDVARTNFRADPDHAVLVQVTQRLFAHIGDVACDLFGAQLGLARLDLMLRHMDRGELVVSHKPFGEDDRVLEVVSLPSHEGDQDALAERQLALVGGGGVGQRLPLLDLVATVDDRTLVDAGALVGAHELEQWIELLGPALVFDSDALRCRADDLAVLLRQDHLARVARGGLLHPGADQRHLGAEQRHSLTLHV